MEKPGTPIITLKVEGMSCSHCAQAVTAAIEAKDPTAKVVVDVAGGTVKAETILPRHVVSMAVEEEGYPVKG
ncbi:heavy-metal-associated domain-containing protein [Roseomonas rosulenta]|uniref:heavy-metal-associated domain-containing protein n=1 Tax=Roseomonas rosulenta TaxID=2748667 RepID=UPI0018DF5DDF|nr:heavy-metal-associated domain-containing protein [Roseomonas rosulenta]